MLGILEQFMQLSRAEQSLFQLGRRLGHFQSLDDLEPGPQRTGVESVYRLQEVTPENIDRIIEKHTVKTL
jgi:hypothetical protein